MKPATRATATPRPARKSAAQLRAEKRAAAKRAAADRRAQAKRTAQLRAEKRAAAKRSQASTARSHQSVAAAETSGKGVLSIASSPSMQVWVDGRNSKAMTPVRILLRTGQHKVTLIDGKAGTSRAFTVDIKDGETTSVTKRYR